MAERNALWALRLANHGNTCYINAVLQCLYRCDPFRSAVTDCADRGGELWRALNNMFATGGASLPPLLRQLASARTDIHQQGDVHEFAYDFLERLHAEVKQPVTMPRADGDAAMMAWYDFVKREGASRIIDIFHGQSATLVGCGACGWDTTSYDSFCCITLARLGRSVGESLEYFFEPEAVPDWRCDKCGERGKGERTLRFTQLGTVLMVVLPAYLLEDRGRVTLDDELTFGGEHGHREHRYRLMSVACHVGSRREGGHYHAMLRDDGEGQQQQQGHWWKMDDDAPPCRVRGDGSCAEGRPYLAFYVKQGS